MIHYTLCPICGAHQIEPFLQVKDFTVSKKIFPVYRCSQCSGMFTNDIPDEQEIGPYYASENYISHTETQQGIINRLYHIVRNHTLQSKRRLVQKETGMLTGSILDVGCGTGAFLATMQQAGWQTCGVERDDVARQNAKQLHQVVALPAEDLFTINQQFDAISLWHVLEHVHDLQNYIEQLKKLLKPKGVLFIAVPNPKSADAKTYKEYWAAYDVPRHLYHFTAKSMRILMESHGLQAEKVYPMWFDSFYVSMLSEKYKRHSIAAIRGAVAGLFSNLNALANKENCSSLIYICRKKG
ncbi:MAG: class I SAM-dependent methyltransferase [Niastella sp.]|nr:class I SAM-dependent methyltransferase [Niastella sp.]